MTTLALNKEIILNTAEQVLCRFGADKATVVDVAKALNISHAAVYRYFPNKAALLNAVVERWLQSIAAAMQQVLTKDGSASAKLLLWFETLLHLKRSKLLDEPELFALYYTLSEQAPQLVEAYTNSLLEQVTELVEEGMKRQELRPGCSQITAAALLQAMIRFRHPAHSQFWLAPTIDQELSGVWELIVSGLAANRSNCNKATV